MAFDGNLSINELKNKYNSEGYDSLTQHEKARLLLSYAEKGSKTDKAAEDIIEVYGNMFRASDANILSLINFHGLSSSSAVLLKLIPVFSTLCTLHNSEDIQFNSSANAKSFFYNLLRNNSIEKAVIIALNKNFKIIDKYIISSGCPDKVDMSFRKVHEFAQNCNAVYVIIAHNHPRGTTEPSREDISATLKIKDALSHIDVQLVDHIIISADNAISMRESFNYNIFDCMEDYHITTDE